MPLSFARWVVRKGADLVGEGRRLRYRRLAARGLPLTCAAGSGPEVKLYPDGHIPELLYRFNFESLERELVAKCLRPGMCVVDAGANVGLYTILADRLVSPHGAVWAFEPSSDSFARLLRNIKLNRCRTVTPLLRALTEASSARRILKRDPAFRDSERYLTPGGGSGAGGDSNCDPGDAEAVETVSLDDWTEKHAIERIDFIKMDIEGGEYQALLGARRTLAREARLTVMLECTPLGCARAGNTQQDIFSLFRGLGYSVFAYNGRARCWTDDERIVLRAGNIWAARAKAHLP